jgi:hypothetical protein
LLLLLPALLHCFQSLFHFALDFRHIFEI